MPHAAKTHDLAAFQQELMGTWSNQNLGNNQPGGPGNPLSYNIMPLPQTSDPDGYILKNFKYYEMLNFNDSIASAAIAPNRGGLVSQNCRALFYEQQVKFAEGPGKDTIVHVENGAWLWLPRYVQQDGPYPPAVPAPQPVSNALQQPADAMIAKQISIPHGNSVLALGSFDTVSQPGGAGVCMHDPKISGSPVIPDAPFPYPLPAIPVPPPPLTSDLNVDARYTTLANTPANYQNPHPDLTQCPNKPLQQAVSIIQPDAFMHWRVTSAPVEKGVGSMIPDAAGVVTNIPFERRVSEVVEYSAEYWLLFKKEGGKTHKYLSYTQTILMLMEIKGNRYGFPHVTCNTLTKN